MNLEEAGYQAVACSQIPHSGFRHSLVIGSPEWPTMWVTTRRANWAGNPRQTRSQATVFKPACAMRARRWSSTYSELRLQMEASGQLRA
jgi:hypothetical protein